MSPLTAQDASGALPLRLPTGRLLGVFAAATGRALDSVEVYDLGTGWSALTTATGTVSLAFVDTAGSLLRIRRPGFQTQIRFVANGRADTTPVTVILESASLLPPVSITAKRPGRGPGDTVQALERNGFYERKRSSGAPESAFITSERIERLTLLADLPRLTGREICFANLYIDGVLTAVPSLADAGLLGGRVEVAAPFRDRLDALLQPAVIAAAEFYRPSDVPAQYNRFGLCATLIWTRQ